MLNIAALMGRLTADPELRHTTSGIAVVRFTLAVNRSFAKAGEDRQTDFIDIVAWRTTAEFVSKYFHKGQLVAVNGSIRTRTYQDKNGNNRKAFEIVADNVHFAEAKKDNYAPAQNFNNQFQTPQQQTPLKTQPERDDDFSSFSNGVPSDFEDVILDDDLPF
ncbi:MAG: single-stranded DNA-binding protein [Clostridia bacterium]|nr:single-stranded DNA-binding protein [Clostridia bacterium]